MAKTLIAYFSHTGENYFGGTIKNITKGNTHVVAEFAQKATGGDMFEIKTVKTYPVNYKECCDEAQAEGRANARRNSQQPFQIFLVTTQSYSATHAGGEQCLRQFLRSWKVPTLAERKSFRSVLTKEAEWAAAKTTSKNSVLKQML